jgi:hypothetical protein
MRDTRTTLIIEDAVFRQLKTLAAEQGRPLSQVTREVLQRGPDESRPMVRRKAVKLPSFALGPPRVDVAVRDRLLDLLGDR